MHRLIAILLTLLILGLPATALAQEPADGVINGQVINGTEGGGSVAEVEVTLITYIDDVMAGTRTTRTGEEGKFQFGNVATEHEYLVSAKYMEVYYYYPVTFEPGETTAYVEVGVCDATTSDEAIKVGLAHTIVSVEEESIQVTEVFWLVNDGDRTYAGTVGVLVFTLPEGALSFDAPQELMLDYQFLEDNRVTYLVPFPPGERQLIFSYLLAKSDSAEFTIPLEVDYPTDILELMVEGDDIEVAVTQLAPAEPVITGTGERFIHFRGEGLPRSTVLNLRLYDMSGGSGLPLIILWVIIAVVIVGIAVYLLKRKKRQDTNE
jgi:hypothetical protein